MKKLVPLFLSVCVATMTGCAGGAQPSKENMHVYIVHGYLASPSAHWFPWLKREMEKRGASVSIIELPSPEAPQVDAWQAALKSQIKRVDGKAYFVAHSLGGITLLRFLEAAQAEAPAAGYILVSGFNEALPVIPELTPFAKADIDYERLQRVARERVVIAAQDDVIVPHAMSEKLAAALDARFVSVEHGNHFMESDGFTEMPLVLEILDKTLTASR